MRASKPQVRPLKPMRDGFANLNARLGVNATNLNGGAGYQFTARSRDWQTLEAAYLGNWIAGEAIDAIPEDMTRNGIELQNADPEVSGKLLAMLVNKGIWAALADALRWGRLYGGAVAFIEINGADHAKPLEPAKIGRDRFVGLRVYDRYQIDPDTSRIVSGGPFDGLPEFYKVRADAASGVMAFDIHHSRIIRTIGNKLPYRRAIMEQLWGASVLERLWDRLIPFDTATAASAQLVHRAHLRTVKVNKLREIFAAGGKAEENLLKMFEHVRAMQQLEGITLLDSSDEYEAHSFTFAGLSDVILQMAQQLSGAMHIPLVRLFGQSPAGLNSTGDSDWENYYSGIAQRQETDLRGGLQTILACAYTSLTGAAAPADLTFTFAPLKTMSAADKASAGKTIADTIIAAHSEGLIPSHTAMAELKRSAEVSGLFGLIDQEDIDDAKLEIPPPETDPTETQTTPPEVTNGQ